MRCPSCGALLKRRSLNCLACGAIRNKDSVEPTQQPQSSFPSITEEATSANNTQKGRTKTASSLVEFPGVTKHSMPQWRKELGERVREVQERRAREAALEAGKADQEIADGSKTLPGLELLPQAQVPPLNPLVAAALKRIERAHVPSHFGSGGVATAVAYQERTEFAAAPERVAEAACAAATPQPEEPRNSAVPLERVHNLAVVPTPVIKPEPPPVTLKPRRLIGGDLNDPALNYLDSIPMAVHIDNREYRSAPMISRILSSVVDLLVVCALSSPIVALVLLTNLKWEDLRVMTFAAGALLLLGFLYLTISTAMTGRTLGMKFFSLRVVDARTGLIPTGGQSAGRAIIYLLSLASAGTALMYAFIDSERHTPHDRFTRTAVIRT
ncbi:MAG TPA: hypothetical protein DHU55_08750 [Blastocatellia bacterium]|nr:hypothetical protein [Blastocatellia bacterium]HCX29838.1 hypothetical protein [Blastocatellia bacterium]